MRFARVLAALFAMTTADALHAAPDLRSVTYRSPFRHAPTSGVVFDLRNKFYAVVGFDTVTRFQTCDGNNQFDCLYIDDMNLALSVPKAGMSVASTWRIGKFRFVIRDGGSMKFGGRLLSYSIIDTIVDGAPQDRASMRATYDPKFGVVCWSYLDWPDEDARKDPTVVDTHCAEDIGLWPRGH